ncbi:Hypothetical protein A7982_00734 [Minicystis rosea]|nr:Hypothetical protein A7982_00734 [Minicystis rosea]
MVVMAALFLHLAHPAAQLAVRAVLWASVFFGVIHFNTSGGLALHTLVADKNFGLLAAACALLALGGAGLRNAPVFTPVAFRRTLLVSLVGALVQMLLLACVMSHQTAGMSPHPRRVVFDLVLLAAVGLGAAGTYRLRSWGPLMTWLTTAALTVVVALSHCHIRVAGVVLLDLISPLGMEAAPYWIGTSAVLLLVTLPLVTAIVRGSAGPGARAGAV